MMPLLFGMFTSVACKTGISFLNKVSPSYQLVPSLTGAKDRA